MSAVALRANNLKVVPESKYQFSSSDFEQAAQLSQKILKVAENTLLGKPHELRLILSCLLADGHVLIEDVPGVGKTTVAKLFGQLLGLGYHRIQFTNDLLPADIVGTSIFNTENRQFEFMPGPIFKPFLLADELNRATAKTQSAFLQAMEERHVTLDGVTRPLPTPFLIIATQNPQQQVGTFPIPESQLDRFMMRLKLGFPDTEAELKLLKGQSISPDEKNIEPATNIEGLKQLQATAAAITCSDLVYQYILDLIQVSRQNSALYQGLSPRCSLDLVRAAKAYAMIQGEKVVLPDHVQAVFGAVVNHRLTRFSDESSSVTFDPAQRILAETTVPT